MRTINSQNNLIPSILGIKDQRVNTLVASELIATPLGKINTKLSNVGSFLMPQSSDNRIPHIKSIDIINH